MLDPARAVVETIPGQVDIEPIDVPARLCLCKSTRQQRLTMNIADAGA